MRLLTRETLRSFRRAPLLSALSVTTIAFSLFTVGLFGLVAVNCREALRGVSTRVEIVAFLLRGTPPETITLASQDIAAFPEVDKVEYVDEDQALQRAQQELVEFRDAYRDLAGEPAAGLARGQPQGGLPRRRQRRGGGQADRGVPASSTTCATGGSGSSSWTGSATWRASWGW